MKVEEFGQASAILFTDSNFMYFLIFEKFSVYIRRLTYFIYWFIV